MIKYFCQTCGAENLDDLTSAPLLSCYRCNSSIFKTTTPQITIQFMDCGMPAVQQGAEWALKRRKEISHD